MTSRKAILFALFATIVLNATAEEIRSTNVRVYSENKKYYANISKKTNVVEVQIFEQGREFEEWSNWVDWERGRIELVSDDGKYFVVINNDYTDAVNLVTIYSRLKQEAYSVRSILIGREFLKNESGRLRWIADAARDVSFKYGTDSGAESMEIKIIDGRILSIDLN